MLRRRSTTTVGLALLAAAGLVAGSQGCGSSGGDDNPNGPGHDGGIGGDAFPIIFGDSGGADGAVPCTSGLCTKQVPCPNGNTTQLTGTVWDPAGADPLYNVVVYVPNDESKITPDLPSGASCDRCGTVQGDPLVSALTDAKGNFTLDNIPVTDNLPVVVQIGKWRRIFHIPTVMACTNNGVAPKTFTLPKNHMQGNIPLMGISTGDADALECVFKKIGIDTTEFTTASGAGRVHLYDENGAILPGITQSSQSLYDSQAHLNQYDMVILDCEGSQNDKPAAAQQRVIQYANAGGRVFASHYSYVWLYNDAPWSTTAVWQVDQNRPPDPLTGNINTGFPKGQAFADWLGNVNALSNAAPPQIQIHVSRHDANDVAGTSSTKWISSTQPKTLQHYTFNTPVGAPDDQLCGRVVFSDFHVTGSNGQSGGQTFPSNCDTGPLSAQEKVLEFMMFDLASCVQNDNKPPVPPPPVVK